MKTTKTVNQEEKETTEQLTKDFGHTGLKIGFGMICFKNGSLSKVYGTDDWNYHYRNESMGTSSHKRIVGYEAAKKVIKRNIKK